MADLLFSQRSLSKKLRLPSWFGYMRGRTSLVLRSFGRSPFIRGALEQIPGKLVWLAALGVSLGLGVTCLRKSEPLSEEQFATIYAEIVVAAESQPTQGPPWAEYLDQVFRKHRVSWQSFSATIDDYNRDPERWAGVMAKVIRELEAREGTVERPLPSTRRRQMSYLLP